MNRNRNKPKSNGKLPTGKDFPPPTKLTPEMKELRDEIAKYGKKPDFRH